jgi:hypothetical protein
MTPDLEQEIEDLEFIVKRSFGIVAEARELTEEFLKRTEISESYVSAIGCHIGLLNETERLLWRAQKILHDWKVRIKIKGRIEL